MEAKLYWGFYVYRHVQKMMRLHGENPLYPPGRGINAAAPIAAALNNGGTTSDITPSEPRSYTGSSSNDAITPAFLGRFAAAFPDMSADFPIRVANGVHWPRLRTVSTPT